MTGQLTGSGLVRPYLMTGGRTVPADAKLPIEAMVVSLDGADVRRLRFEAAAIVRTCTTPHSVAELSAQIGIPLGVARILVADLRNGEFVAVRTGAPSPNDLDVLTRVIDRVRAI